MLRAERLVGLSDAVRPLNPAEGWIPVMLYELALGLLGVCLLEGVMMGLLLVYRALKAIGGETGMFAFTLAVLLLEGLALLWYGRRRLWQNWLAVFSVWKDAVGNEADSWKGRGLVQRRTSSTGGSGGVGLALLWLVYVPLVVLPLVAQLSTLSALALASVVLAGLLTLFCLPSLFSAIQQGRTGLRRRKRLRLMQEKNPDDWVCPNCLHSEPPTSA